MSYKPQTNSLPWKVLTFLVANPDEELTRGDIVVKFDASGNQVDSQLASACSAGVLKKIRNVDTEIVWILDDPSKLDLVVMQEQPTASEAPAPLPVWKPIYHLDPTTIELEENVPIFRPRGNAHGQPDWSLLLTRMVPGQSCVLPKNKRHVLAKVIAVAHKDKTGRYITALLPDKQSFRLWRVE